MAKQTKQGASKARPKLINGYIYHRTLFNHTGNDQLYIRRLGHLARRDPNKDYRELEQAASHQDPNNWNITIFHEDLELADGRPVAADSLYISNVDYPLPAMKGNPLHSWTRVCGDVCPNIWLDLDYKPGCFVEGIESNSIRQRLHDIYQELISHRKQDPKTLVPLLLLFLHECQRSTDPSPEILPHSLQQMLHVLSDDEGMRMSIEELAAASGCSPRQLSRLCKVHLLRSPIEIRRQQRLLRVTELLEDTQRNLAGIAHQVGYADAFSLSKACRAAHGHSPRA